MEKINGKALAIVGFIIVVGIGTTMFYSNQNRKEYAENLRFLNKIGAETKYQECKKYAEDNYSYKWERSCSDLGRKEGCALPSSPTPTCPPCRITR
jgi:hypothetical protein